MRKEDIYLSSNLKYLRMINHKTQEEVAKYCDKKNTAISNWEKGIREPDAVDLANLAECFNISVGDLLLKDMRNSKSESEKDELDILYHRYKSQLSESERTIIKTMLEDKKSK